jgi:hypothetical protein
MPAPLQWQKQPAGRESPKIDKNGPSLTAVWQRSVTQLVITPQSTPRIRILEVLQVQIFIANYLIKVPDVNVSLSRDLLKNAKSLPPTIKIRECG